MKNIKLHGLNPLDLCECPVMLNNINSIKAYDLYKEIWFDPQVPKPKLECRDVEQFDDRFLSCGFIILQGGKGLLILHKKYPSYQILVADPKVFIPAYKEKYRYHPKRIKHYQ